MNVRCENGPFIKILSPNICCERCTIYSFFLAIKIQSSFFGVASSIIVNDILNKVYRNNMVLDSQNISPSFLEVLVSVTVSINFPALKSWTFTTFQTF